MPAGLAGIQIQKPQKPKDMSRPFVEFTDTPPVVLSCSEKKEVHLKVKPRVAGKCKVSLSLVMDDCYFGNGQQVVTRHFDAASDDAEVNCVFKLFARADAPGNYFTILIAEAENAAGETSFKRPIELEIHCTGASLSPDADEPSDETFTVLTDTSAPAEPSTDTDGEETAENTAEHTETAEDSATEEEEDDGETGAPREQPPPELTEDPPEPAPVEEAEVQPEEASPPEQPPLANVVEEVETTVEEAAPDLVDESSRIQPEKPSTEPSGKSKPGGGCLGLLLILALLTFFGACKLENPELGISTDEVITLTAEGDAQQLLADGFSRLKLTARLGPKADANEEITFFTEFGSFAEAGSNTYTVLASSKTATATLIAGTTVIEDGLLTASVGGFTQEYPIDFVRALPQDAIFTAGKLTLSADGVDFTNLVFELFRNEGQPSDGAKVTFTAETLQGNTGVLLAPFVYADGARAEAELRSANTEPGLVRITASTEGEDGLLERSLDIVFE